MKVYNNELLTLIVYLYGLKDTIVNTESKNLRLKLSSAKNFLHFINVIEIKI